MFVIKRATKYWVLCTFCAPIELFFVGTALFCAHRFLGSIFSKNHEPCAHDAHIIFLYPAIILLAVLASCFLLFAHRCSLFWYFWSILTFRWLMPAERTLSVLLCSLPANLNSLVAAEFSLPTGLYSLHTVHGTSSCSLVVARCSPQAIFDLDFLCPGKGPCSGVSKAQPVFGTSKYSRD